MARYNDCAPNLKVPKMGRKWSFHQILDERMSDQVHIERNTSLHATTNSNKLSKLLGVPMPQRERTHSVPNVTRMIAVTKVDSLVSNNT